MLSRRLAFLIAAGLCTLSVRCDEYEFFPQTTTGVKAKKLAKKLKKPVETLVDQLPVPEGVPAPNIMSQVRDGLRSVAEENGGNDMLVEVLDELIEGTERLTQEDPTIAEEVKEANPIMTLEEPMIDYEGKIPAANPPADYSIAAEPTANGDNDDMGDGGSKSSDFEESTSLMTKTMKSFCQEYIIYIVLGVALVVAMISVAMFFTIKSCKAKKAQVSKQTPTKQETGKATPSQMA